MFIYICLYVIYIYIYTQYMLYVSYDETALTKRMEILPNSQL